MITKEAVKCLNQFSKIINIIENKIMLDKDDIIMELYIELDCNKSNLTKIFRKFYSGDCGLDGYINNRKICRVIEELYKIDEKSIQNEKIRYIIGKTREQFNRMITIRYNHTLNEFLSNKELFSLLEQPVNVEAIYELYKRIDKSLLKMDRRGIANVNMKRTKVEISNMDIQKMTKAILTRKSYVYYGEIPEDESLKSDYVVAMIINDRILERWETVKKTLKNKCNGEFSIIELASIDNISEEEIVDNAAYLLEDNMFNNLLIINKLAYYVNSVDGMNDIIEYFKLPQRYEEYGTILSKTKYFIEEIIDYNINFLEIYDLENIVEKTKQQLLIHSYYDADKIYIDSIEKITQTLNILESYVFKLISYVEDKKIKGFSLDDGYRKLKKKFFDLQIDEYEAAFKTLLLRGYISLKEL